jgi:hypothetical protein
VGIEAITVAKPSGAMAAITVFQIETRMGKILPLIGPYGHVLGRKLRHDGKVLGFL